MPLFWDLNNVSGDNWCEEVPVSADDDEKEMRRRGFERRGQTWQRMRKITSAIIWASGQIGMDEITRRNLKEWFYRLESMFDAGVYFLHSQHAGQEIPIRISMRDLMEHVGLVTSAPQWSKSEFDRVCRVAKENQIDVEVMKGMGKESDE